MGVPWVPFLEVAAPTSDSKRAAEGLWPFDVCILTLFGHFKPGVLSISVPSICLSLPLSLSLFLSFSLFVRRSSRGPLASMTSPPFSSEPQPEFSGCTFHRFGNSFSEAMWVSTPPRAASHCCTLLLHGTAR